MRGSSALLGRAAARCAENEAAPPKARTSLLSHRPSCDSGPVGMEAMHDQQVVDTPIAWQAERRKSSVAVLMQWLLVLALV